MLFKPTAYSNKCIFFIPPFVAAEINHKEINTAEYQNTCWLQQLKRTVTRAIAISYASSNYSTMTVSYC